MTRQVTRAMEAAGGSVAGADPHRQTVSVTVLNERGGLLGTKHFKVWCRASGDVGVGAVVRSGYSVRIENASGIGRHTAMFLIERGVDVRDVCRHGQPSKARRRREGKSDALDAARIACNVARSLRRESPAIEPGSR
jgi:hypothetical protein